MSDRTHFADDETIVYIKELERRVRELEGMDGKCVAPPCKCDASNRHVCAYWNAAITPAQDKVVVPREIIAGMLNRYGHAIDVHLILAKHKSELETLLRASKEQS